MVDILSAVLSDGLAAVEAACLEALREGVRSADVIINILARRREPRAPGVVVAPDALRLLRPAAERSVMDRVEILAAMAALKLYGMKAAPRQ